MFKKCITIIFFTIFASLVFIFSAPPTRAATEITGGLIATSTDWTSADSPYIITGTVTVIAGATLNIGAGTEVRFDPGAGLNINGTLRVNGSSGNRVIFTSSGPNYSPSAWGNINLSNQSKNSFINYARISYGRGLLMRGSNSSAANCYFENNFLGVYLEGGAAGVADNTFTDNITAIRINSGAAAITGNTINGGDTGINIISAPNAIITGNTFNTDSWPIVLAPMSAGVNINDNNFIGARRGIYIKSGFITADTTLTSNQPYIISGQVVPNLPVTFRGVAVGAGAKLKINPGVIIKFEPNTSLLIGRKYSGGTIVDDIASLEAAGAEEERIVFTSINDDEYGGDTLNDGSSTLPKLKDWLVIYFSALSENNTLNSVIVRYADRVYSYSSSLTIANSIFEHSHGGLLAWTCAPTIANNIFRGLSSGISVQSGSPQITENEFSGVSTSIGINSGAPAITGNTITGGSTGLLIVNSSSAAVAGNTINTSGWPVKSDPRSGGINLNDNYFIGPKKGIYLNTGNITENIAFTTTNYPYVISNSIPSGYLAGIAVYSGAELTLNPGVILKMEPNAKIVVGQKRSGNSIIDEPGSLRAEGTAGNPVVITSIKDDEYGGDTMGDGSAATPAARDWSFINFAPMSFNNILDNTIIRYADRIYVKTSNLFAVNSIIEKNTAGLTIMSASPTLIGNAIRNNAYGLTLAQSNSLIFFNEFSDNAALNIYADASARPALNSPDTYNYTYGGNMNRSPLGNYWDDYSGVDADNDGIGDTPYLTANSQDSFPLVGLLDSYTDISTTTPNSPPVLSFAAEDGYGTDADGPGVDPNKGQASSTVFTFKVVFADSDNDAPINISAVVSGGAVLGTLPMTIDSSAEEFLRNYDYIDGEQYTIASTFPQGKYQYYFTASDGEGVVRFPEEGFLEFEAGYSSIIFIPGIQASRLYKEGTLTENQLWEPNRNADVEKMYLDEGGNSLDPDIYTRDVIDEINLVGISIIMPNIYKSFLNNMNDMVEAGAINQFEPFPYDWRLGVESFINNPIKTKSGEYSMILKLAEIAESSQTGKVSIITHSTGGLAAKYLISRLEAIDKAGLVDKFIMVACPQYGTPKAVASLLHGDEQAIAMGLILNKSTAREFGRNMLTAYELLPSERYFERVGSPIIKFDPESGFLSGLREFYGDNINSSEDYYNFLLGYHRNDNPEFNNTDVPIELSAAIMSRTRNLRNELDSWIPPENLRVVQVVGWGLDTISGTNYTEKETIKCPLHLADGSDCYPGITYDHGPIFSHEGDETVMASSADAMVGVETYYLNFEEHNKDLSSKEHADIMEVYSLQILINDIVMIASTTLPKYFYNNRADLFSDDFRVRVAVHSPVVINIYNAVGQHTGLIENFNPDFDLPVYEEQIPNSYYLEFGESKYVGMGGSSEYRLELRGTDYGTFTLGITKINNGSETIFSYMAIPVTPDMKAEIVIQDMDNIGVLEIDLDGDGQIDIILDNSNETKDPSNYISYIQEYVEISNIDKQLKKYLLVKLGVIEKQINKNNSQAADSLIGSVEIHIKKMIGKFISVDNANILLEIVGNLKKLML